MKLIDKIVMIVLTFVCLFIAINHVVFNLFGDTAFKFALLYILWIFMYAMAVMMKRGEL